MKFAFLMDPLETVQSKKDTSFAFMLEAHARGHEIFYLPVGNINLSTENCISPLIQLTPQDIPETPFVDLKDVEMDLRDLDALFIRTEPPFDNDYLMHTWLLEQLESDVFLINKPAGVRSVNEKIWSLLLPEFSPRTLVSRNIDTLKAFLAHEGKIVAKPTDGFGGQGVFILSAGDINASVSLEVLSEDGTKEIIVQEFIPEASEGDKRILLLNGDPLGAVLRLHGEDDHRNNFMAGGSAEKAELTEHDLKICAALKPKLQELGLTFVGIDIMGDKLTEVNVTSPTCLREMCKLDGVNYVKQVIEFVERRVNEIAH